MVERTQIGRYASWIEDGTLHLYSHEFGRSFGFSARMTPEETMKLLAWLSDHHDEISLAARDHVHQPEHAPAQGW